MAIGRRAVLGGLAATGFWRPLVARAQQDAVAQIGILNSVALDPIADRLDAFLQGLEDTRFVIGRNLTADYRSADGNASRLPALAAELVRRNPQVIACLTSANTVHAAMAATSTIPIVFAISGDPVELGLVGRPEHPDANVTGAARSTEALNPERLKVLSELLPQGNAIAFLFNSDGVPAATNDERIRSMEAAARTADRKLVVIDLAGKPDLPVVFATMAEQGVGGFVIATEALFNVWRDQVIGLSASYRIAAMFPNHEYVQAGGLISYGADLYEHYLVAGTYAGRILKGEKPADLPVQIPTKFEMAINLKTAGALSLVVPEKLVKDATEVIE